jgi:protein SCO1/2
MATERKTHFVSRYIRDVDAKHIHFLTGRESSIKALTSAVGFNAGVRQGHGSVRASGGHHGRDAEGKVSRYLYGVEFAPAT